MRLSLTFFVGALLYGAFHLGGLQCRYLIAPDWPVAAARIPEPRGVSSTPQPAAAAKASSETADEVLSLRDYVHSAIRMQNHLAILYWNSSGHLDSTHLVEQCQFRNGTNPSFWPFYLQNVRIPAEEAPKLAFYPLSDNTYKPNFDFSVPAPIPLLAHTLPFKFSTEKQQLHPWLRLLPTPYELDGSARRQVKAIQTHRANPKTAPPFAERIPQIIYRGHIRNERKPEKQRTRLLQLALEANNSNNQRWLNASSEKDGQHLFPFQQLRYKYQIDVGGLSGTTWVSLRWKMCSGSLVFKVDSGFADWWHKELVPYQHYVPVQRDLSDLYERYQWAEGHPDKAKSIVQNAMDICAQTTALPALRDYVRKQIRSLPSPTLAQLGEYHSLLESSRHRLQRGQPSLLFNTREILPRKATAQTCPPELDLADLV